MNTLKETVIGVIIIKVHGEGALKRRIMEWYTKDMQVYVRKVAPLGDPIEITKRV